MQIWAGIFYNHKCIQALEHCFYFADTPISTNILVVFFCGQQQIQKKLYILPEIDSTTNTMYLLHTIIKPTKITMIHVPTIWQFVQTPKHRITHTHTKTQSLYKKVARVQISYNVCMHVCAGVSHCHKLICVVRMSITFFSWFSNFSLNNSIEMEYILHWDYHWSSIISPLIFNTKNHANPELILFSIDMIWN